MSQTNENQNNANIKTDNKPFVTVNSHEEFPKISSMAFMKSTELCGMISGIYKKVWADYEGCTMVPPNRMDPGAKYTVDYPTIAFHFNQKDHSNDSLPCACTKSVDDKNSSGNTTLRKIRNYDHRIKYGDKYFLTDEGKAGIDQILYRGSDSNRYIGRDGAVRWGDIIAPVADVSLAVPAQYSKVMFIDPVKCIELIYGKFDEAGNELVYNFNVLRSIPMMSNFGFYGGGGNEIFMISIERITRSEVDRLACEMGLSMGPGLNIVR